MNFKAYFLMVTFCLPLAACAGGGTTRVGNATGGTVNIKGGDICAGRTASCSTAQKEAQAAAAAAEVEAAEAKEEATE
ncbi:hypothetical protein QE372_002636 [Agrobacterium pusense]|uniref:hypothetical protein n=1 Tax=Agrobacterium pusense TaxID=648995 RepID=UPI0028606E83|nr:hypothetical protein [Agrobacterium pusense]MDR6190368.1 hypothetical protein [Agrobacterium pusense]